MSKPNRGRIHDRKPSIHNPEVITVDPQPTAVVAGTVQMAEIRDFFDSAFHAVFDALQQQGVAPHVAFGYYPRMPTDTIHLEVGFTTDSPITSDGKVIASELPGGEVARATYVGAYEGLAGAYGVFMEWIQSQGRQPGAAMWEVYVTEPSPEADPSQMRTDLYWTLA